ncbi:hypothetical protein ACIA49_39150 [Kribbella sp. NPDC051587]|uniref:hypothetical protein n=1 Tax=Kribbella sp. NPDC051587 TaxID=3364119 RepID=UPI0037B99BE0
MDVTINDPDDVDGTGVPIYEGPADEAYTLLAAGTYPTTVTGLTVLVSEHASIPAMIDRYRL